MGKTVNTAIIAVFNDGKTKEYPTIEECSEDLKIPVKTIKKRANRTDDYKADIIFKWSDESTLRHFKAKRNRQKGLEYERKIIRELSSFGYNGLVSSRSQNKRLDDAKIDIAELEDHLSCYIQIKDTNTVPSIVTLNKEVGLKDRPLSIFWKAKDGSEYVIIPKKYFYNLFNAYEKEINKK